MHSDGLARCLPALGAALAAVAVLRAVTTAAAAGAGPKVAVQALVVCAASLGLVYAGRWHRARPLADGEGARVGRWMAVGAVAFAVVTVVGLFVASARVTVAELGDALLVAGSVGLLSGVAMGTVEARAVASTAAAASAETRVRALEAERSRIERRNAVLKHYVRNCVTVVHGQLHRLESAVPGDERSAIETVRDQMETVVTLVDHLERVSPVAADDGTAVSVDLAAALAAAVDRADVAPSVDLARPAEDLRVRVHESFEADVALLLDAIGSVTAADGAIAIGCERRGRDAVVALSAAGATLPPAVERSLFEPIDASCGLKFYLAASVIREYGDVTLRHAGDDGLVFEVVVPADAA